jgi:hypothetical protein
MSILMRASDSRSAHHWCMALAWAGCTVVGWVAPARADERPRLDVSMVKYGGTTAGGPEQCYSQFRRFLQDRVQTLPEEVEGETKDLAYLGQLSLRDVSGPGFPSLSELENYWRQTSSLAILQGNVFTPAGKPPVVQSRIYLGALSGTLAKKSIMVEMAVTEQEFANTSDSHSAVLLYGLAVDARRVYPQNKALTAAILKSARDKLADRERRGTLPRELLELKQAILAAEGALKGN